MKKGISPVVAVVLLIAIAVIASVAVWFWVSPLTAKPATASTTQKTLSIESCDATNNRVFVRNSGGLTVAASNVSTNFKEYTQGGTTQLGYLDIPELSPGEAAWATITNTSATDPAESGNAYEIQETGYPTMPFTC